MGIDAVHLNGAMTGVQDYNAMRQHEDMRMMMDHTNFQHQIDQNVDEKLNQVQEKDKGEFRHPKFDAKEKGNNAYDGDGGKGRDKHGEEKEKPQIKAPFLGGGFDMKI